MKMLDVVLWCLIAAMLFLIGTFFFLNNVVYAEYPGSILPLCGMIWGAA